MFVIPSAARNLAARSLAALGMTSVGWRRRYIAGLREIPAAEEKLLHLRRQKLARRGLGQREPVLVDQPRLVLEPLFPGLLADLLVDALAERARVGRALEAF